jgi:hypothetical protein
MTDTFTNHPEARWRFIADGVMGGLSSGQLTFNTEASHSFAQLTGTVSTANNGGFIQMRSSIAPPPPEATGVRHVARGNNQQYFIHLRSAHASRPTAFYRASFDAPPSWHEIHLPFAAFSPAITALPAAINPAQIASVAVVAYGRNHSADISVYEIGYY